MNRIEISESAMMETLNALCGDERAQIVREVYTLIEQAERRGYEHGYADRDRLPPANPQVLQAGTEDGIYQAGYDEGYNDGYHDKADADGGSTGYDVGYQEGFEDGFKDASQDNAEHAAIAYDNGYAAGVADERTEPLPGAIEYTEEEFYRAMDEAYERGFTDCSRNS